MNHEKNITRAITFPKELKDYLDCKAKESMRTFVSEVVYRVKKSVEEEMNAKAANSN